MNVFYDSYGYKLIAMILVYIEIKALYAVDKISILGCKILAVYRVWMYRLILSCSYSFLPYSSF